MKRRGIAALKFVIIGGGPTGVEMAGAIAEIARHTLAKDFRHIDPSQARVILIEGEPRLLAAYPDDLRPARENSSPIWAWKCAPAFTPRIFRTRIAGGRRIHPLPRQNLGGGQHGVVRRQIVRRAGRSRRPRNGQQRPNDSRPPRSAGDRRSRKFSASNRSAVARSLAGCDATGPSRRAKYPDDDRGRKPQRFWYFDKGSMATIGRNKAVADLRLVHLSGIPAWLAWLFIHVVFSWSVFATGSPSCFSGRGRISASTKGHA